MMRPPIVNKVIRKSNVNNIIIHLKSRKSTYNPTSIFSIFCLMILFFIQQFEHNVFVFVTASISSSSNDGGNIWNSMSKDNNSSHDKNDNNNYMNKPWSLWSQLSGGDSDDDGSDSDNDDTELDKDNIYANDNFNESFSFKNNEELDFIVKQRDYQQQLQNNNNPSTSSSKSDTIMVEIEAVIKQKQQQSDNNEITNNNEANNNNNGISSESMKESKKISSSENNNNNNNNIWPPLNPVDWASIETDAEASDSSSIDLFDWDHDDDNQISSQLPHIINDEMFLTDRKIIEQSTEESTIKKESDNELDSSSSMTSKPMETLLKLQQMLDETDYLMSTSNLNSRKYNHFLPPGTEKSQQPPQLSISFRSANINKQVADTVTKMKSNEETLWTSKDRSKYKKQQKKLRRAQLRLLKQQLLERRAMLSSKTEKKSSPHPLEQARHNQIQINQNNKNLNQVNSVSESIQQPSLTTHEPPKSQQQIMNPGFYSQEETDDEDGLGYTLPNLPVYYSDAEDDDEDSDNDIINIEQGFITATGTNMHQTLSKHSLNPGQTIEILKQKQYNDWMEQQTVLKSKTKQEIDSVSTVHQQRSLRRVGDGTTIRQFEGSHQTNGSNDTPASFSAAISQQTSASLPESDNNRKQGNDELLYPPHVPTTQWQRPPHPPFFGNSQHPPPYDYMNFHHYGMLAHNIEDRHRLLHTNHSNSPQNDSSQEPLPFTNPLAYDPYSQYDQQQQSYATPPIPYGYPSPSYYAAQQQWHAEQYAAWAAATAAQDGSAHDEQAAESVSLTTEKRVEPIPGYNSSPQNIQENISHSRLRHVQPFDRYSVARSFRSGLQTNNPIQQYQQAEQWMSKRSSLPSTKTLQPGPSLSNIPGTQNPVQDPSSLQLSFEASNLRETLAEATSNVNYGSLLKISTLCFSVALIGYSAVSPRTLPLAEYNLKFFENIRILSLATISPLIVMLSIFDAQHNNGFNSIINTFFFAFTAGYVLTFIVEILATTIIRLAVFRWIEPRVFTHLTPKIPVVILPWVLRENRYRPKRITLFVADFITSCVAAPIIEEYAKLVLLQSTTALPKNFNWVVKTKSKRRKIKKHKLVAEPIVRQASEHDITNANQYVTSMLATSLGFKLCDACRRILLYTKPDHAHKGFYSFCRGWFPIQELCGTMTAIGLAKRDLLGIRMPIWKLLGPAIVIHAMANFRGMKPIFKWNSSTPWSEMQLSPLNVADSSTLPQLLKKGYAKLMWIILLSRIIGYCVKNYYMVNRQAVKRTTTYAGKHSAFSAEIATTEMLRSQRK